MKKLGVYIHIPFCNRKCTYCDFVSGVYSDDVKRAYFNELDKEIRAFDFTGYAVDSVYFGGGTPSSVPSACIAGALDCLRSAARTEDGCEITVECNPESLTGDKVADYAACGVNRLSIGLQSATDSLLERIGRLHTTNDFVRALDAAQSRFDNVSADIMLGLPGQTSADIVRAVKLLAGRNLSHVSAYALKVEEGTPLAASGYTPDEDYSAELYETAADMLLGYGYRRYEVSNFAFPGFECRHNMRYWTRGEYRGFGVAAHSFVRDTRFCNTSSLDDYLRGVRTTDSEYIPPDGREAAEETLMLALRTADGLDLAEYRDRFGTDPEKEKREALEYLDGYVEIAGGRLRLTDKGFYVMNEIIVRLLSD